MSRNGGRKGRGRMELTVKVKLGNMPTMRTVAQAAEKMSMFDAQVLLRQGDITVNAKSLMGLLSLGLKDGIFWYDPAPVIRSREIKMTK